MGEETVENGNHENKKIRKTGYRKFTGETAYRDLCEETVRKRKSTKEAEQREYEGKIECIKGVREKHSVKK